MTYPTTKLPDNFFATITARASQLSASGADVIRLDIGSPDLPPAPHITAALSQSAHQPNTHGYQSHRGPAALCEAWAGLYQRLHGVALDPDGLVPLLGSKEGVFHLSLALLNPGDIALVPDPGYQTYGAGAVFAGADPVTMPLLPENGFLPNLEAIPEKTRERAKILWLNYPNNPTAAVASLEFFTQVVDFCHRHNILLCHDAAYTQVTFDGYRAPSVLEVPGAAETAIEFNTLSKSHNMAGWRIGVAAGQTQALTALFKLKTHADSGHFLPVMEAATAALTGDQSWLKDRNQIYVDRRDLVVNALRRMGLNPQVPRASLYVWCPLPEGWTSSSDFVLTLLEQAHVSLAPGMIFGPRGEGFVRISLVQSEERLAQAMERMSAWCVEGGAVSASRSPLRALR
jgi:LL-diaminopimelate aminotransferase